MLQSTTQKQHLIAKEINIKEATIKSITVLRCVATAKEQSANVHLRKHTTNRLFDIAKIPTLSGGEESA